MHLTDEEYEQSRQIGNKLLVHLLHGAGEAYCGSSCTTDTLRPHERMVTEQYWRHANCWKCIRAYRIARENAPLVRPTPKRPKEGGFMDV